MRMKFFGIDIERTLIPRLPINDWIVSGEPVMAQEYLSVA